MKKTANLQDIFLTKARKQGVPLTVFLVNGFQMRGSVTGFDSFTVVLLRAPSTCTRRTRPGRNDLSLPRCL